jgi:hypothetical protein
MRLERGCMTGHVGTYLRNLKSAVWNLPF